MAAEVEIVGWKVNQPPPVGLRRDYYHPSQYYNSFPSWVPPQYRSDTCFRMKRSSATVDPPPQCALNPQDAALLGNSHRLGKDDKNYPFSPVNRGSGRNPHPMQRQPKREPQPVNQAWSNNTFENSNTSWEGDWSNASSTPPIKTEPSPSAYYNHRTAAGSFQSSSEWSPGESSASSSMAYGMMQSPSNSSLSASSSSYYESNGFYGAGYGYGQGGGYMQPPYGTVPLPQQYHDSVRTFDGATAGSYNNHRNPSSCPQALMKQPVPDYQRKQTRYPVDGVSKMQIKREPEDYNEVEGENFTSLFTKSLTSLYSQDTENSFPEVNKPYEPDLMVCSPLPLAGMEDQSTYQRLNTSSSNQYSVNAVGDYQDTRSSFGFYESRNQNCEQPQLTANVVEELGADGDRMNSFRYDRPSFDDMHLYTSPANDSKGQAKKRKINMPNATQESGYPGSENRKKTPRLVPSYKSDSQWTPNSFAFSDIQIKQEPIDDYNTNDMDTQSCSGLPFKESSPSSNGNKSPGQQPDHPKQPPRKRSPGATCFDRFDKKSTPTNKKVSPLSVYAKVQENVVLSVKCRRYKKRTKPITSKEESVCPGREEMELYKQNSLTPDQAAHQVMSELLERVSLFEERSVIDGPNLTQMDALKVRELLMQFCHRYSLDYRDFEDINSVLKPRIIIDNLAKNSERASAIRKRTSTSPVQTEVEPQPVRKTSSKAAVKKAGAEETKPAERRVLRSLPGRVDRSSDPVPRWPSSSSELPIGRRYSTRSGKDVGGEKSTQVDIIISSSTDSESEAGKEAEVRKKSQRLKKKSPATVTPARSRTSSKANSVKSTERVETRVCTRSRENGNASKTVDVVPYINTNRINLRSRRDRIVRKDSTDSMRSSSVEILDITKSDRSSYDDTIDAVIAKSFIESSEKNNRRASKCATKSKRSQRVADKSPSSKKKAVKNDASKTSSIGRRSNSPLPEATKIETEDDSKIIPNAPDLLKESSKKATPKRITRKNSDIKNNLVCDTSEIMEVEPSKKLRDSSKKPSLKNNVKNSEVKDVLNSASCDVIIVKEEFSPKELKNSNKNSSIQNNFDETLSSKDQGNSKSHFSAIKMKKHCPNKLENVSLTNSSKSSKTLKNNKRQIDPCVNLKNDLKMNEEAASKTTKAGESSSRSSKPSKLIKRNSKKLLTDMSVDTINALGKQNSSDSFTTPSVSSKSSKEPRSYSASALEEGSESIKGVKSSEPLPETPKSKKISKENARISIKSPLKSSDASQLPKEKSRKPNAPKGSPKTSKLDNDKSKKSVGSSVESNSITKLLTENPIKTQNSHLEAIKSSNPLKEDIKPSKPLKEDIKPSKPIKEDIEKSSDSFTNSKKISELSKELPTSVQVSHIPSKLSRRKVDDLVAAVSSLVESEKKSKLLENDKKTMAAHSLLELGNSPQFLKVGSVSTSIHRSTKSNTVDCSPVLSKSLSNLTLSTDSMTSVDSWKLVKENYETPEVVSVSCNNSREYDKPVTMNVPFAYNAESYEKPVAVNSPLTYRNSEKYEKQVAVNTPYLYRNSENYEKPIALNTPYIYRKSENYEKPIAVNTPYIYRNSKNYEKPVAVNTPYIYRNSENREKPTIANSPPIRNSLRLRKVRDKRPVVKLDSSSESDKPNSLTSKHGGGRVSVSRRNSQHSVVKDLKTISDSSDSTEPCATKSFNLDPMNSAERIKKSDQRESLTNLPCENRVSFGKRNSHRVVRDLKMTSDSSDSTELCVKKSFNFDPPNCAERRRKSDKPDTIPSLPCEDRVSFRKRNSYVPIMKDSKATSDSSDSTEPCARKSYNFEPLNCAEHRKKRSKLRMFSRSSLKPSPVKSCSELSDSEPQVVLTKLPDVHVNSKDGSVSAEVVKLCEMTEGMNSSKPKCKYSAEKPPVLVSMNTVHERASSPSSRSFNTSPPCIHSVEDLPVNLSTASPSSQKKKFDNLTAVVPCLRSESEDSDCGLVIDLDRRTSIEERVPSPTLQSSDIIEGMKKASVSEDPRSFFSDQPVPSTSSGNTDRSAEEKEASHTLLELTRSMLPPMAEEDFSAAESEERRRGRRAREVRERARDESILRTLLLETGAIGPRAPQDRSQPGSDASTVSTDSKNPITRLLLLCETNDEDSLSESASIDDRKFPLEIITDFNANSLLTTDFADHQDIKEQIRKLKNEIVYLKCIADEKDRERTAVVCFKRSSLSEKAIEGSVQIIQQTTSNTRKSSFGTYDSPPVPMPDSSLRRNPSHSLRHGIVSHHSSQSPPFHPSEFGASENSAFSATSPASQNNYPIPLVVSERKIKSSRKVHSYTTTSSCTFPSSCNSSSRYLPGSPYSIWNGDGRNSIAPASLDYQIDRTETISSTIGSSYINRFSSSTFVLPPHPTASQSISNSSRHLKIDGPKNHADGRKSLKNNSKSYDQNAERNMRWPEHKNECGSASEGLYDPAPNTSYH